MNEFGGFEKWLRYIITNQKKHHRWGKMRVSQPENVLEHSVKQTYISISCYHMEMRIGNPHAVDILGGISQVIHHDLDEVIDGDEVVHKKNKDKANSDEQARDNFKRVLDEGAPDYIRNFIKLPPNLDKSARQVDKDFWQACELIGYAFFALEEARIAMEWVYSTDFDPTLVREWDSVIFHVIVNLNQLATRFASIDFFTRNIVDARKMVIASDLMIKTKEEHDQVRDEIMSR